MGFSRFVSLGALLGVAFSTTSAPMPTTPPTTPPPAASTSAPAMSTSAPAMSTSAPAMHTTSAPAMPTTAAPTNAPKTDYKWELPLPGVSTSAPVPVNEYSVLTTFAAATGAVELNIVDSTGSPTTFGQSLGSLSNTTIQCSLAYEPNQPIQESPFPYAASPVQAYTNASTPLVQYLVAYSFEGTTGSEAYLVSYALTFDENKTLTGVAQHAKSKETVSSLSPFVILTKSAPPPPPPMTTSAPTTTMAPTTKAPTTMAPTTMAPTTKAPTTMAPTTKAPTTMAPTTKPPSTQPASSAAALGAPLRRLLASTVPGSASTTPPAASSTEAPSTMAPTTMPPTMAPTTMPPTMAPTTMPPTMAPTTMPPTTMAPTTKAPAPPATTMAPLPPVAAGNWIYAFDKTGVVTLFDADTLEVKATDKSATHASVTGQKEALCKVPPRLVVNQAETAVFVIFTDMSQPLSPDKCEPVPTTAAPTTAAPTTAPPTSAAPTTAPPTSAPGTMAPTSAAAESTAAPSTAAPSTAAPSTAPPATTAPTTAAKVDSMIVEATQPCYALTVRVLSPTTLGQISQSTAGIVNVETDGPAFQLTSVSMTHLYLNHQGFVYVISDELAMPTKVAVEDLMSFTYTDDNGGFLYRTPDTVQSGDKSFKNKAAGKWTPDVNVLRLSNGNVIVGDSVFSDGDLTVPVSSWNRLTARYSFVLGTQLYSTAIMEADDADDDTVKLYLQTRTNDGAVTGVVEAASYPQGAGILRRQPYFWMIDGQVVALNEVYDSNTGKYSAVVGQYLETAVSANCADFKHCDTCAAKTQAACGWCSSSSTCVSGDADGPTSTKTCAAKDYVVGSDKCTAASPKSSGLKPLYIVLIAVGGVAVIGGAIFICLKQNKKKRGDMEPLL